MDVTDLMASPRRLFQRFPRTWRVLAALALASTVAAVLTAGPVARADDEDDEADAPAAKAEPKPGGSGATTNPATRPAHLSAEVHAELDAIRDAYAKVESLRLAGTIKADLEINGDRRVESATFESTFQAPARFRHSCQDGEGPEAAEDTFAVNTADKLYVYKASENRFVTAAPIQARAAANKLAKQLVTALEGQNPSLLLALTDDAAAELLRDLKSMEKGDDVTIDGTPYTALKVVSAAGSPGTVLIDPGTHLVRRVTADVRKEIDPKGQQDVKKAELTIDYTTADTSAAVKPEQFAWKPPETARESVATAAVALGGDEGGEEAAASALEGKAAPDFTLKDAKGNSVSLSELKGSVVVLDFWATWCGPCVVSLPHLDKIYNDHKGAGLKAFAVNLREDEEQVQKFVDRTKLGMPVLFDGNGKVAESYSVTGIPQTVVVGKDGTVKKVVIGSGTHETIRKAVEEAMR